jgi:uncharacterized protein (DUF433 family)
MLGHLFVRAGDLAQQRDFPYGRIEIDPAVMLGKPVIRGTRVPVELLLRRLAEGASEEALLASYPHLDRDDIRAALAFAADEIALTENLAPTS